jgi:nitrite reductase (NAD(P)H)
MPEGSLNYHLNTLVTEINPKDKVVKTSSGDSVSYDVLVLATGSDALLPRHTPGHDAQGVFVYRTIDDLQRLIKFSSSRKGTIGTVVGGGLLGLEAAHAMMDLNDFSHVKLIERNRWVLSRQLDSDAGGMVVDQVRAMGLDVMLSKRVGKILTTEDNAVKGVVFEDGEQMECSCICFAVRQYANFNTKKLIGTDRHQVSRRTRTKGWTQVRKPWRRYHRRQRPAHI